MTEHPAKSPAQRRALDEIGCGNNSPFMTKATRDSLLKKGLIQPVAPRFVQGVRIEQFEMPIPVHYQWCQAMSEEYDKSPD